MAPERAGARIDIRPFAAPDRPFLARVAQRLHPGETVSPREPAAFDRAFADLADGKLLTEPGAEAFVATIDGEPCGLISLHPDADYFTGHPRAFVDVLVVAGEAEGRGVGRALLAHAERWAREHRCREVVMDVFADNAAALAFYGRCGYRADHIRMAKPVE